MVETVAADHQSQHVSVSCIYLIYKFSLLQDNGIKQHVFQHRLRRMPKGDHIIDAKLTNEKNTSHMTKRRKKSCIPVSEST